MIDGTSNHWDNVASKVTKKIPTGFDEYCVAETLSSWKDTEKSKSLNLEAKEMDCKAYNVNNIFLNLFILIWPLTFF